MKIHAPARFDVDRGEPNFAIGDLGKTVKQLAEKLEKLETALTSRNDDALLVDRPASAVLSARS